METEQVAAPVEDKTVAEGVAGQGSSALTEPTKPATEGVTPAVPAEPAAKPAWVAQLEGDLQKDDKLTQFKTISELGKAYRELEGKLSKEAVPGEKATADEVAKFYKLEDVKLPKTIVPDKEMASAYLDACRKAGVSAEQAKAIYGWYMPAFAKQLTDASRLVKMSSEQAEAKLREEFGADFDAAQTYKERAFRTFFNEEAANLFVKSGLGNSPSVIKGFIKLGKSISEHAFADGSRGAAMESGTFGKRTEDQLASALYPEKKGT
jgi:hypothetical protein